MARELLAIRHVQFQDLGLLAPLLAERGYRVRYHDIGIDPRTLREANRARAGQSQAAARALLGAWLDGIDALAPSIEGASA